MTSLNTTLRSFDELYMEEAARLLPSIIEEDEIYDGEAFVYFNMIGVNIHRREIVVGVSYCGKIGSRTFDLSLDSQGFFFVYGPDETKIYVARKGVN